MKKIIKWFDKAVVLILGCGGSYYLFMGFYMESKPYDERTYYLATAIVCIVLLFYMVGNMKKAKK